MDNSHKRRRLEPDRIGLTPAEQVLLVWVFCEKRKANEKYREMTAYWVKRNLKAFCYFKPQLITKIDTNAVECLTIYKYKLFSGSIYNTIRVWDADTHTHVGTLEGHTDRVFCLTIYKNKLFSGSRDNTIRVWDVDE